VGLIELGFRGVMLATGYLVVGGLGKVLTAGIGFLVNPDGFANGRALVHWPEPTFRNFVAVALLALLASRPHAHAHARKRSYRRDRSCSSRTGQWPDPRA